MEDARTTSTICLFAQPRSQSRSRHCIDIIDTRVVHRILTLSLLPLILVLVVDNCIHCYLFQTMNYNKDEEEATARAVAAIEETLQGFSSPMVGQSRSYNYNYNAMEWMQEELKGANNEREASMLPVATPKRTPMMERAGTPIMSNSSKLSAEGGNGRSKYALDDSDSDSEDEQMPMPVQTPIQRKFRTVSTPLDSKAGRSNSTTSQQSTSASSIALKQSVFRRHHDALWEYLLSKRSIENRMDLERKEKELEAQAAANNDMIMATSDFSSISESLSKQECKTEVDFCKNLRHIGYGLTSMLDNDDTNNEGPMEEGHFWDLLATLRKLSLPALIWDDDNTSATQNLSSQAFFLQQLASKPNATPKELVEAIESSANSSLPLVLERKQQLLKWIQSCLELESKDIKSKLPSSKHSQVMSQTHPDDPNLPNLISEMDSNLLKTMAQVCLTLFLEGKNDEALEILRSRGQFARAAMFQGGDPYGYSTKIRDDTQTLEESAVGNPNRFLWKRQVWKTGRKLLLQQSTTQQPSNPLGLEEAAICSILSDDVQNALENPCIRSSWTRSLCVLLMGVRGRTQDEVVQKNNSYKRRSGDCFAGYQYEQQENEQLMYTAGLASMTEAQMAKKLSESIFLHDKQQQEQNSSRTMAYKAAIMAFVVGKSAILEFCATETARMVSDLQKVRENDNDDEYVNQDWEGVRFLTHLTLFLDSLQGSSTPIVCDGITDQKNAILFQYVQYLESRPDLWHMITLYVGLLPENIVLDYFPTVLARVLDDSERKIMAGQIRELIPALELPLLRKVVRLSLSAPSSNATKGDEIDAIKCNSLQWLLQKDEHLEDALICANILLREFFLDEQEDKTGVAMAFLSNYLPQDFLELVKTVVDSESTTTAHDEDRVAKVNNAFAEHKAYLSYLEAYETFQTWRETLKATPTSSLDDSFKLSNYSNLNETERSIADSNRLRSWLKNKKEHLEIMLKAAQDARNAWHAVLTHDGGWLAIDEDDHQESSPAAMAQFEDPEELQRKVDLEAIRSRHLVLAANLYHQVCEETATWLSKSLHEASDFSLSQEQVLHKLRSTGAVHTPEYWYQHALDLANLVASDAYGIGKAFPPSDLKELISKLAETAVSKLMNV